MKTVAELRAERLALHTKAKGIQALADTEGRTLRADESQAISECLAQFQAISEDITRRESLDRQEAALSGTSGIVAPPPGYQATRPGSGGFRDLGDYFRALGKTAFGHHDARLTALRFQATAGDFQNETTPGEGGYAVPVDARKEIERLLVGQDDLLSMATPFPISGPTVTTPVDQSAPWDTTLAFTDSLAEGDALVEDKAALAQWTATTVKAGKLVYCSSELLRDGSDITGWLAGAIKDKLTALRNTRFLAAVKGSSSKVSVTRGTGQGSGASYAPSLANLQAMLVGLAEQYVDGAIWLTSRDMIPALQNLTVGDNKTPVFMPGNTIANKPYDTLFGIRVVYTEVMNAAPGAADDILLVNPRTIVNVYTGSDMPRFDVSAHAAFAKDLIAYRWIVQFAAKSRVQVKWTRPSGSTCSNIVGLTAHA